MGLGFAGRTEDRMSGRRTSFGGSGEADPVEKRSSSSSSKAVEADCSPAAAGARKEPRKRSELGELLCRARSMAELSVCCRVCRCEPVRVDETSRHWWEVARRRRGRRADADLGSTSLLRS